MKNPAAVALGKIKEKIFNALKETSGDKEAFLCDEFGVEMCDIEEIMLEHNYERCPDCEWWCEAGELTDENSEQCACESCR